VLALVVVPVTCFVPGTGAHISAHSLVARQLSRHAPRSSGGGLASMNALYAKFLDSFLLSRCELLGRAGTRGGAGALSMAGKTLVIGATGKVTRVRDSECIARTHQAPPNACAWRRWVEW
jgi:hypothetical protein